MSASNSPARYVLVLHFIVAVVFAVPLLLFAYRFAHWVNWHPFDPTMAKMIGAAMAGLGVGSLLAARDPLKHRVIVQMEIVYTFVASVAVLYRLVRFSDATPHFAWVPFAATTVFFVLFSLTYPRAAGEGVAAGEATAVAAPAAEAAAEAPAAEAVTSGEGVGENQSQADDEGGDEGSA
jgi:hypothetical protein